jgi:hypothetical protein
MKKRRSPPKKTLDCLYKRVYVGRVNDGKPTELEALRSRYEKELQDAESKVRILKAKLNALAEIERDARAPIKAELPQEYADLGVTEAILKAITELRKKYPGEALGFAVIAIKDWMLTHGFKARGEFDIAVSVTLKRLRDSGRVKYRELCKEYFYKPVEK